MRNHWENDDEILVFVVAFLAFFLLAESVDAQQPPVRDLEETIQKETTECVKNNENTDFGVAEVDEWCKIKSYSILGDHYPDLARIALRRKKRINRLNVRLSRLKKRPTTLEAILYTSAGTIAGVSIGLLVSQFVIK